jgi:hypothetical protein
VERLRLRYGGHVCYGCASRRAVGPYKEIEGWGGMDDLFLQESQLQGCVSWRTHDLYNTHLHHPKKCDDLRDSNRDSERYSRCVETNLRMEGSQLEMAAAYFELSKSCQ